MFDSKKEFPGGRGGVLDKLPSVCVCGGGGLWIFSGTTQY